MREITAIKTIFATGNSLALAITSEARYLDLDKGDKVRITLEKVDG